MFEDVDRSAYSGIERPAFNQTVQDIQSGLLDEVLVWKLSSKCR